MRDNTSLKQIPRTICGGSLIVFARLDYFNEWLHYLLGISMFLVVTRTSLRRHISNCCRPSRGWSHRNKTPQRRRRKDISSDLKSLHSPHLRFISCSLLRDAYIQYIHCVSKNCTLFCNNFVENRAISIICGLVAPEYISNNWRSHCH